MSALDPLEDPEDLLEAAARLENAAPEHILRWAIDTYRGRIVLACSFGGATGIAALDMIMRIDPATPVYFLDTGLLFPETYALMERLSRRYGLTPIAVRPEMSVDRQAELHGAALWERRPDDCCAIRKIAPQRAFLSRYDAWISGIRRDQASTRSRIAMVEWDEKFSLVKVNPFASWDDTMVWAYIRAHKLPYNELHDRGYPSIGCSPCTRAIAPGEAPRSGRWPGFAKIECGLHGPSKSEADSTL
jgi:phosphoadenosine phosphosulfate reductase